MLCEHCRSHINISHGSLNDVTCHVLMGSAHKQRMQDAAGSQAFASTQSHSYKLMLAEVLFSKILLCINTLFQAADLFQT